MVLFNLTLLSLAHSYSWTEPSPRWRLSWVNSADHDLQEKNKSYWVVAECKHEIAPVQKNGSDRESETEKGKENKKKDFYY